MATNVVLVVLVLVLVVEVVDNLLTDFQCTKAFHLTTDRH